MDFTLMMSAFALMLIFEGIGPFLFPKRWRSFILKLAEEKPNTIRQIGLSLLVVGSILLISLN